MALPVLPGADTSAQRSPPRAQGRFSQVQPCPQPPSCGPQPSGRFRGAALGGVCRQHLPCRAPTHTSPTAPAEITDWATPVSYTNICDTQYRLQTFLSMFSWSPWLEVIQTEFQFKLCYIYKCLLEAGKDNHIYILTALFSLVWFM